MLYYYLTASLSRTAMKTSISRLHRLPNGAGDVGLKINIVPTAGLQGEGELLRPVAAETGGLTLHNHLIATK